MLAILNKILFICLQIVVG